MSVLVLTLAGPLQAWGSASRFTTRATDDAPTKSGIVGLLAAARGLRRSDPVEDLTGLRFGARIDQMGELLRDFQTARSLDGKDTMPLSYRFYRADACYLVGLEGDRALVQGLADAIRNPEYPLYLGRRSCPPSRPLDPQIRESALEEVLLTEEWRASRWFQRKHQYDVHQLEFRIDAEGFDREYDRDGRFSVEGELSAHDIPVSFDPEHREYGWRTVLRGRLPRPDATEDCQPPDDSRPDHEPMDL